MNKYFIFPLIILVSGIVSCNKPPGSAHPPAQFHADSIAILAKANQFRLDKEYDSAISLLDSAFLLPVKSNQHPNGLPRRPPSDVLRNQTLNVRIQSFPKNSRRTRALPPAQGNEPPDTIQSLPTRDFGMRRTNVANPRPPCRSLPTPRPSHEHK